MTARVAAVGALLGLLLAGCTTEDAPPAPRSVESSRPAPSSSPVSPSPAAPSPPRLVRIALAGDIHFEGTLAARLDDPATALAPVSRWLADADVTVVNLETSLGSGGRPEPGKRFTFSAGTTALRALAAAGVDVATMANNHALDFGRGRLPSTLRAARRASAWEPPLDVIGVGQDADEAFRPALTRVGDSLVAILTASVADQDPTADPTSAWAATAGRPGIADALDPARLLAELRRTRASADVVVVYLHWGVQGDSCPSADQRRLAGRLVAAGADIVVGSHTHRLQGDGRLGRGYVAYGLGNFAWYTPGSAATARTGVLTLTVRPAAGSTTRARVVRTEWQRGRIGASGLPTPLDDVGAAEFDDDREALRRCAGLRR